MPLGLHACLACDMTHSVQANDFEAYQELLREQGAKETQGERYEVITKFLNDTEDYLHKLAGKVSNVKLQQEASEAFTKATAEARAMVRLFLWSHWTLLL